MELDDCPQPLSDVKVGSNQAARAFHRLMLDQQMDPAYAIGGLALALGVLLGRVSHDLPHLDRICTVASDQVRSTATQVFASGEDVEGYA